MTCLAIPLTRLAACIYACALGCSSASAASADDVKALLDQGKDREAYEAGKADPASLGSPLFDFYFAIAALNAGVPGEGVLALERYLLQFPENRSARFHLARGYFILGEDQRAREEFSALADTATGSESATLSQFLDAIRARESRYKPTSTAFVEIGGGYDSNINSGIKSGQVAGLPTGFVVVPGQSSEQQSDAFATTAAGVQGVYPIAPGIALYGGGSASGRFHAKDSSNVVNQTVIGLQGGVTILQGRNLYRAGLDFARLSVGNQAYLNLGTLVGEWQYQQDQFNRFGLAVQWSQQSYNNVDVYLDRAKTIRISSGADIRDSNLTNVTASWTRSVTHPWNPVFSVSVNAGSERNRKDRPDLSRTLWGGRVGATIEPGGSMSFGGGLSYQNSRFDRDFAAGLPLRQDDFLALDLSSTYAIDRNWSLRAEYQHVAQRSTIGFFK